MYARNYSAENDDLTALNEYNVTTIPFPVVPCQDGWKFEQNDPEATTVVADVSLRLKLFQFFFQISLSFRFGCYWAQRNTARHRKPTFQ